MTRSKRVNQPIAMESLPKQLYQKANPVAASTFPDYMTILPNVFRQSCEHCQLGDNFDQKLFLHHGVYFYLLFPLDINLILQFMAVVANLARTCYLYSFIVSAKDNQRNTTYREVEKLHLKFSQYIIMMLSGCEQITVPRISESRLPQTSGLKKNWSIQPKIKRMGGVVQDHLKFKPLGKSLNNR